MTLFTVYAGLFDLEFLFSFSDNPSTDGFKLRIYLSDHNFSASLKKASSLLSALLVRNSQGWLRNFLLSSLFSLHKLFLSSNKYYFFEFHFGRNNSFLGNHNPICKLHCSYPGPAGATLKLKAPFRPLIFFFKSKRLQNE
jgi:hypothetical protein